MNDLTRIKKKWMECAPHEWWGDSVDVRFYLITQLRKLRNLRILDVGCSAGLILSELDSSNIKYGFDIAPKTLKNAGNLNPNSCLLNASFFEGFPYQAQSFDVVIMANVMPYHEILCPFSEKAEQKTIVFNEVYRILKPGGKLFLTTPNGEHLCYRHTQRIWLHELRQDLKRFNRVRIYGWNMLPSFVCFLPNALRWKIPPRYHKFLFLPSPALARVPYSMKVLTFFMTKESLLRKAKAFYVECEKM